MNLFCGMMLVLAASVTLADTEIRQEDAGLHSVAKVFQSERVDGTLVVASSDGEVLHVYNDERAKVRFSPASTFKILNTLIALDAAVVRSKYSSFKWDGTDRGLPAWNRGQTLQSAFRVSCVWCYQEIAREVGANRYVFALAETNYGNEQIGRQVDLFWLNGELRISALEQVDFLKRLLGNSIPYRREHIDIVKAIMFDEQSTDYAIHAKSGWTGPELHVGWYVGYVEKGDNVWLFAMNMRMDSADQASLRKELTIRSLRALGIL